MVRTTIARGPRAGNSRAPDNRTSRQMDQSMGQLQNRRGGFRKQIVPPLRLLKEIAKRMGEPGCGLASQQVQPDMRRLGTLPLGKAVTISVTATLRTQRR